MKEFVIDFKGVKTYLGFYEALIKGLEFPDWCGKNPDAIWDLLTGYMEHPATIYIKGIGSLPKDLEDEADLMMKIFYRAVDWYARINLVVRVEVID